ncbi:MAG: efflux RND transporter periplasmic adaptor subunit [Coriobacteriia bacterium]|nr:efflux RND transporter periplasmic adaptor subunit [Coriobacteriia bacterium]
MSRGKIIAGVVGLLVVGGIVAGVVVSAQNAVPLVTAAKVETETLGVLVTASGKIEAADKADVFPPTAGILDSVSVKDGQQVKAGDTLASMETAALELQVSQARAGLKAAQAQLDGVNRGVPAAVDKSAAAAGVSAAQTGYDAASGAYSAYYSAYLIAGSPASMETTLTQLLIGKEQAYAGLLNAKSGQTKLTTMSKITAAKAAASAGVDQARRALALAEDTLDKAILTAPMDGLVIFNALGAPGMDGSTPKAEHGSAVGPQSAVFTVVQMGALNFNAQVDEADIDRIKTDLTATVRLDAFPSDSFAAKVVTIRSTAMQTTTGGIAFPVLISVNAPGKNLLLGMSGSVDIEVSAVSSAVTVPIEALFDENGKKYVFVISSGKVTKTEVTTGALTDVRAQVLTGVTAGQEIAVGNLSTLKDGMAVRTK